ncbi:PREDICTED: solute carrier organic anion transporter family member 5A1-like [Nicrophorus vespilloides]|uniref:Solute carrier organic anion transporter family member n=1 Tax=Nicrophorus vespilloides TaxID=110193 RepID=A0ABM1MHX0_NICVS|nr:PREDICTED: solute carrier organic anion transporter family member 5A1-like [Nicrophorus vespilloides]XP_017774170.1 PREDICTED: solute carrier organic anion transporter family member 5A1-like [Nicrophorus vespilloides]XP_017774171.1 PREDICTED: solute carrier organic anion transporter family member 5A1-like [Nicrophorus vespilloides]XP_017774172.1 PREDICTED: solute carrier organic anion transporter family member 5A1-like [Nicrophorus vespilloides]
MAGKRSIVDGVRQDEETLFKNGAPPTLNDETTCGFWVFRGSFLQPFANKKAYVFLYGILGCMFSASYAYHNGTITTLEKRFKIPSRTTGIITIGNDLSQLMVSMVLSYYTGGKHKPRWMALGLYTVVIYCLLTALPHWLYGPGEDALSLTEEFGAVQNDNATIELQELVSRKALCQANQTATECETETGGYAPAIIFFLAQFISGIGAPLFYTLGVSYMDDNIKKSKTPALISVSIFLRMLGPAMGYTLASFCLNLYISPSLTPTITNRDPRWLGAWWLGWIILAGCLFVFASLLALFPKTLPRAAARRLQQSEPFHGDQKPSFKDMIKTFRRVVSNPVLMFNNVAAIFYFLGYMPYWIFLPKYIETQYRQSSSASSLITGTAGLVFSAIGVLLSGLTISKFKPKARYLAGWNVVVGAISVLGIISYVYLGCVENDNRVPVTANGDLNPLLDCNANCNCDYVKYNPVCARDGTTGFISACHAGCKQQITINGTKVYQDCSCISHNPLDSSNIGGEAIQGNCFVDCMQKFYIFLIVVCILKFSGATGRASNFLVTVRCVDEKDKPVAMGFGLMMMSLFAFVPSPILFGIIIDKTCLLWGKTCKGNGNCWLYNGKSLRYTMNYTAAFFVTIGTFFDLVVWYLVRDLKIFDDDVKEVENAKPETVVETELENLTK